MQPANIHNLSAAILAGGKGQRLGGCDKGWYRIAGKPMIQYALDCLRPQVGAICINANRNLSLYRQLGHPVHADAFREPLGPMAGIASVLDAAATPYILTVPVDTPLMPVDLGRRLRDAMGDDVDIVVACTHDQKHPLHALMHRSLGDDARQSLTDGIRKVQAWQSGLRIKRVFWEDELAFRNINTREEARLVEGWLARHAD